MKDISNTLNLSVMYLTFRRLGRGSFKSLLVTAGINLSLRLAELWESFGRLSAAVNNVILIQLQQQQHIDATSFSNSYINEKIQFISNIREKSRNIKY